MRSQCPSVRVNPVVKTSHSQIHAGETFDVRPTNGPAQEQIRRNQMTQYFFYPGYEFVHLRRLGDVAGQCSRAR